MFRRRKKLPTIHKFMDIMWPRIGWKRAAVYWMRRVSRLPGSSYSISAGFAFGAAVSFTPFIGLHILISAIMSYFARANIFAAAIGTIVGNPWTFPFIWVWIYSLGTWMGVGGMPEDMAEMQFAELFGNTVASALRFDWDFLVQIAWPIFGPMLAGSVPTFIIAWVIFYFVIKWIIDAYGRKARRHLSHADQP